MHRHKGIKNALILLTCSAVLAGGLSASSATKGDIYYKGCSIEEQKSIDAELKRFEPYFGLIDNGIEVHCGDYFASSAELCYTLDNEAKYGIREEGPLDLENHLICLSHEHMMSINSKDTIHEEMAHIYHRIRAGIKGPYAVAVNRSDFTNMFNEHMLCDGTSEELDPLDIYGTVFVHQAFYLFDQLTWPGECFAKYLKRYMVLDDQDGSLQEFKDKAPDIYRFFKEEVTKNQEPPF